MATDEQFSFVCDPEHVDNMIKVISHNDGKVVDQTEAEDGIYFTVIKKV